MREVLEPGSNGPLFALALERGLSLRQVTALVETAQRLIVIAMKATHPEGWRGAWRRFRSRSNPLLKWEGKRTWRWLCAMVSVS